MISYLWLKNSTKPKQKSHNLNMTMKDLRYGIPIKNVKTKLESHRKYFEWL